MAPEKKPDEAKKEEKDTKPGERPVEPDPKAEILEPEDVAAAKEAVDEAKERAEASDGKQAPEVLELLKVMAARLDGLEKKLAAGEEITADELDQKEQAAVALGHRSIAGEFLAALDACLSGVLRIPRGLGGKS